MAGFGNNLSFNILSIIKSLGRQSKEIANKLNSGSLPEKITKSIKPDQTTPNQSLVNTNSNISINQPTLTNPALNQAALNATNIPQTNLNTNIKLNTNIQVQPTPSQVDFQGPKDLPAYAGVSNMSLKSWIAAHDTGNLAKTDQGEKLLAITLQGIKGFQRQNYEGFGGDPDKNQSGFKQGNRNKNLLILSQFFSCMDQSPLQETELFINIVNFKKLGSSLKDDNLFTQENTNEIKLAPPLPNEFLKLNNLDVSQLKYLHELLALPSQFPECIRLFAKDRIELNSKDLKSFLVQRLELIQSQIFGESSSINNIVSNFVPLLNTNDYTILLPLILLYYPLPLPQVKENIDFINEWKSNKEERRKKDKVIASCDIYYKSKKRGMFLLKFELSEKHEFSFDIQTSTENNGIVKDLEVAIAESMYLLEYPPVLSDLNVMLTEEIYKATDIDEELSIVSCGALRLEIILATYAALVVLNKLNDEIDPSGLIEMSNET